MTKSILAFLVIVTLSVGFVLPSTHAFAAWDDSSYGACCDNDVDPPDTGDGGLR